MSLRSLYIHTPTFSGVGEREWGWCCFRTRSHLLEASVANNCKDVHGSVWGCVKKFGSKQPSPKRTWLIIKAAPCSLDTKDIVCLRMITKLWRATCSGTSSATKLLWATCSIIQGRLLQPPSCRPARLCSFRGRGHAHRQVLPPWPDGELCISSDHQWEHLLGKCKILVLPNVENSPITQGELSC